VFTSESCSRGVAERVPAIRFCLTLNTKRGPWNRNKPLRVDCFFALLADSEGAFMYAAQSRTSAAKLLRAAVDIRDRERTFRRTLDFIYLIGASINRDTVTFAGRSL